MARNKIRYYPCGCCEYSYNDTEVAKGSHYEIGDDDDMPYKRRKKKGNPGKAKPFDKCRGSKNHLFVWVKYMHQNYREEKEFLCTYMMHSRYAEPGEFVDRYEFRCVGCGFVKHSVKPTPKTARWRYYRTPVPAEYEIYEVRHLDKYGKLL